MVAYLVSYVSTVGLAVLLGVFADYPLCVAERVDSDDSEEAEIALVTERVKKDPPTLDKKRWKDLVRDVNSATKEDQDLTIVSKYFDMIKCDNKKDHKIDLIFPGGDSSDKQILSEFGREGIVKLETIAGGQNQIIDVTSIMGDRLGKEGVSNLKVKVGSIVAKTWKLDDKDPLKKQEKIDKATRRILQYGMRASLTGEANLMLMGDGDDPDTFMPLGLFGKAILPTTSDTRELVPIRISFDDATGQVITAVDMFFRIGPFTKDWKSEALSSRWAIHFDCRTILEDNKPAKTNAKFQLVTNPYFYKKEQEVTMEIASVKENIGLLEDRLRAFFLMPGSKKTIEEKLERMSKHLEELNVQFAYFQELPAHLNAQFNLEDCS